MRIRCPHCTTDVALDERAGPAAPNKLTGFDQACGNCGDEFSVYLY